MKATGKKPKEKASVSKSGPMVRNMSDSGKITKPTDKERFTMPTEMSTKENGSTTRPVVKVPIHTRMEPNMSVNGKMINKMDMVSNNGSTDRFMKVSTRMEPRPEKASLNS